MITINVKSGTGGYYDLDNCDMCIKKINNSNFPIPRIGESIQILEPNDRGERNILGDIAEEYHTYLVTDVKYWIVNEKDYGVTVYVIPIGRKLPVNHS